VNKVRIRGSCTFVQLTDSGEIRCVVGPCVQSLENMDPSEACEEPEEKETEEKSNCYRIRGATGCTFCFRFITNSQPLHVSSITRSSSGGVAYTAIGIFCAYSEYKII
jgi:hypothetical protein